MVVSIIFTSTKIYDQQGCMLFGEAKYNTTSTKLNKNSSIMTGSARKDMSDHPIL